MSHDDGCHPTPEAAFIPSGAATPWQRQSQRVDAVAQQAQHGRQQRQRRQNGENGDDDRPGGQAAVDVRRHDKQPHQAHDHSAPREEHRPARGRPRPCDRLLLHEAASALFAEAMDDEQRVVYAQRQADHRNHVDDQKAQLERLPDQRRRARGHDDGDDRQDDRDAGGDRRAEHQQQDKQRDRQSDEFASLKVLLRRLVEGARNAPKARGQDLEAFPPVRLLHQAHQRLHVIGRVFYIARDNNR